MERINFYPPVPERVPGKRCSVLSQGIYTSKISECEILNSFQRAWNRGSEKARHVWARAHDLLNFICSFLLNNDVDHMTVATLSGHKSLKVLKDRYGHYDDQTLERAMSVFDRIVGLDPRKSPAVQK